MTEREELILLAERDAVEVVRQTIAVLLAANRLNGYIYLGWGSAGGPNECKHGYARGIHCPSCDQELVNSVNADKFLTGQLLAAALPKLEAMAVDRERLNWLERNRCRLSPDRGPSGELLWEVFDAAGSVIEEGGSTREVIDAARAQVQPEPKPAQQESGRE